MSEPAKNPLELFCCYAHEDKAQRNALNDHLSILKRQKLIEIWYDGEIGAGMMWEDEIDKHLSSADVVLLLVSAAFLASEYCYSKEMQRALQRHEEGTARVVPIILRPVDWEQAPFGKLQVLPTGAKPVASWRSAADAYTDIAKGLRRVVEDLQASRKAVAEERLQLRAAYLQALLERYGRLDFKGIMHIEMHRPLTIPLEEVFVFPDLLVGIPEYETPTREDDEAGKEDDDKKRLSEREEELKRKGSRIRREIRKGVRGLQQRERLPLALAKSRQVVILGDPGSGKSTLLRYLILRLAQGKEVFLANLPQLADSAEAIPLHIPLANYAEFWRSRAEGRSLRAFMPHYFQENYLHLPDTFLETQLVQGKAVVLLDGLDEIPDTVLRTHIVRQIEAFTTAYQKNRFFVTSRIVGYKEVPISAASGYQTYTLADFNEQQVEQFAQQWCPAYERWVKGTTDRHYLEQVAREDAEKLFRSTQRNPGVKRLAVNPLLLTILALIQRQGRELPSHRVELFDLCATTLLETWVKARGTHAHLTKTELIKILRPLAFWMHQHPEISAIPLDELKERILQQFHERTITGDEADKRTEDFLQTVRGETGILIERGKDRYGFLHLTFEEFFAALELEREKEDKRSAFIKAHLHEARWREVILLTVGTFGILRSNEERVTELLEQDILQAQSPFEEWLHRDLLFAGLCLADDVGLNARREEAILEEILYRYLTSPYDALRQAIAPVISSWSGTKIGEKASAWMLPLLKHARTITDPDLLAATGTFPLVSGLATRVQKRYQGFARHYQESQFYLLRLYILSVLSRLDIDTPNINIVEQLNIALNKLTLAEAPVRQGAATALGQLGQGSAEVVTALLSALGSQEWQVRQGAATALGQLGQGSAEVVTALLSALGSQEWPVRQGAATALGQLGQGSAEVVTALLSALGDAGCGPVRQGAATALGQLGQGSAEVVTALLSALGDSDEDVRQGAATALGQLGQGSAEVVTALLSALGSQEWQVRQGAATALGQLGQGSAEVVTALLSALGDSGCRVRQGAATALGQQGQGSAEVVTALLSALGDAFGPVRQGAATALGQLGQGSAEVVTALLSALGSQEWQVRQGAATALGQLGQGSAEVVTALLSALGDSWGSVRQGAATALGQLGQGSAEVVTALLSALGSQEWQVRQGAATALGQQGQGSAEVVTALLSALGDAFGR